MAFARSWASCQQSDNGSILLPLLSNFKEPQLFALAKRAAPYLGFAKIDGCAGIHGLHNPESRCRAGRDLLEGNRRWPTFSDRGNEFGALLRVPFI
jgi:hypothetical protein